MNYLALHSPPTPSVDSNSLSCFLIRKIYRIHFDFLGKKKIPSQGCLSRLPPVFPLLISPLNSCWGCSRSDSQGRVDSGLPHCWLLFRLRLGLYIQGRWAQMQLFLPRSWTLLRPLVSPLRPFSPSVSFLPFLSNPAHLSHAFLAPLPQLWLSTWPDKNNSEITFKY